MNKNIILVSVMLVFFGISGYLIYSNFFSGAPTFVPGRGFGQDESGISASGVSTLDSELDQASRNLDEDGLWKKLEDNQQYSQLSDAALIDIEIGEYGHRENPFLPIEFEVEGGEDE